MVFFNALNTPGFLDIQQAVLSDQVCPSMPDPKGCNVGLSTWWSKISGLIFSETGAQHTCFALSNFECDVLNQFR